MRKVAVYVDCTKMPVAVVETNTADAVEVINVKLDVVGVLDITTLHEEFRAPETLMLVITDEDVVPDTLMPWCVDRAKTLVAVARAKTAVAVPSTTSIKYHVFFSLAIAQSRLPASVEVTGKNRFTASTVFGGDWYLNVIVFVSPIDHAPVNVQTRKTLALDGVARMPNVSGPASRSPPSTVRTTLAIRSAAGFVNVTRSVRAGLPSGFFATVQSSSTVSTRRLPPTAAFAA